MADETKQRKADATPVEIAPANPDWPRIAAEESARIMAAIGDPLLRIEHIGSTAIPGLAAKPVIDLMPVLRVGAAPDLARPAMESLGYRWRGEFGIPGRGYCVMERDGRRLFHVHFYAEGNDNISTQLAFRDYLRAHPQEAADYEAVKRAAATAHPDNSMAYNEHKSSWIRACQQRALAWAASV